MSPLPFSKAIHLYRFTTWREKRESGAWWKRELIDTYLRPVSLDDLSRILS